MSVWHFCHLILLFKLLLLLFMGSTALFDTIHESYCTISANFYLYLQYFQQKVFYFSKISEFQTDPKVNLECPSLLSLKKRSHLSSMFNLLAHRLACCHDSTPTALAAHGISIACSLPSRDHESFTSIWSPTHCLQAHLCSHVLP